VDHHGGYGVGSTIGLKVPSGVTLLGSGYAGRLIPVGAGATGSRMIQNANSGAGGDTNITLCNLYIDGGGTASTDYGCIRIDCAVEFHNQQIRIEDCTVVDWPGAVITLVNTHGFSVSRNVIANPNRGGIICRLDTAYGVIAGNVVMDGKDDCIAVLANSSPTASGTWNAPTEISIVANTVSEAASGPHTKSGSNNGIAVHGLTDSTIVANTIRGAGSSSAAVNKANIAIIDADPDLNGTTFYPKQLLVAGNRLKSSYFHGVFLSSDGAEDITIRDNMISSPRWEGISLQTSSATALMRNIVIAANDIVDAGSDDTAFDRDGIRCQSTAAGGRIEGLYINDNRIARAASYAVNVMSLADITFAAVNRNVIHNANYWSSSSTNDAIRLQGIKRFQVLDNEITDERVIDSPGGQHPYRPRYGVNIRSGDLGHVGRLFILAENFRSAPLKIDPSVTKTTNVGDHKTT